MANFKVQDLAVYCVWSMPSMFTIKAINFTIIHLHLTVFIFSSSNKMIIEVGYKRFFESNFVNKNLKYTARASYIISMFNCISMCIEPDVLLVEG